MSRVANAPPLTQIAGQAVEESLVERLRAVLGTRSSSSERHDEELHRALERAFAEFAREMQG
jgi:hypothetical protein